MQFQKKNIESFQQLLPFSHLTFWIIGPNYVHEWTKTLKNEQKSHEIIVLYYYVLIAVYPFAPREIVHVV